jgi:hypothetical protein
LLGKRLTQRRVIVDDQYPADGTHRCSRRTGLKAQ